MRSRGFAFLLVLVLLWSGFATQEQLLQLSSSSQGQLQTAASAAEQPLPAAAVGSVSDHHLDDQPVQLHVESALDLLGLIPAPLAAKAPVLPASRPGRDARADWLTPFLAGPQRPPCAAAAVA